MKEKLSGRFADIASHLYIMSAILRKFSAEGKQKDSIPVVEYALEESLSIIDKAMEEIYINISENQSLAFAVHLFTLLPKPAKEASTLKDKTTKAIVYNTVNHSNLQQSIFSDIFIGKDGSRVYNINLCFKDIQKASDIIKKIKLSKKTYQSALNEGIIRQEEYDFITKWDLLANDIIQVDSFPA